MYSPVLLMLVLDSSMLTLLSAMEMRFLGTKGPAWRRSSSATPPEASARTQASMAAAPSIVRPARIALQ